MKRLLYIVIALAVLPVVAWTGVSCQREGYVDESKVELEFSADTLTFDTVFTSYSTPTRLVKIYNRTTHNVLLSSITLGDVAHLRHLSEHRRKHRYPGDHPALRLYAHLLGGLEVS